MATNYFKLKSKDTTHHIYSTMLGEHVQDTFVDAWFSSEVPTTGDGAGLKAVCQKYELGYTMRNAGLTFRAQGGGGRKP